MPNIMFKIGTYDYSDRVVGDAYSVQKNKVYTTWEDANGTEHRSVYRTCVEGSFSMLFKNIDEYKLLRTRINALEQNDGSVRATLFDNYSDQEVISDYFIEMTVGRSLNGMWQDDVGIVSVSVKER